MKDPLSVENLYDLLNRYKLVFILKKTRNIIKYNNCLKDNKKKLLYCYHILNPKMLVLNNPWIY